MGSRMPREWTGNRLLDALPIEELEPLRGLWEITSWDAGEELCREESPLAHVHFPVSGIYSTVVALEDGNVVEASTVGNEGIVGLSAVLGLGFSPKTATTPVAGECLRLPVRAFRSRMKPGSSLDRLLHRYAAYALRCAYQTAACNAVHSAQERMCRWLLTSQDRMGDRLLRMTHEFLAQLLGVRRQTVTVIAGILQGAGLIRSRRGVVRILDRVGLEGCSCECYRVTRWLYERIVHVPANTVN